ncbi:Uncharacterised protein [Porphyromonas macacae]|uniref:Uncharacterized protein n=1 Tax=Porphyromonas macacae TaxID=28115 RepID=A0A379EAK9_9PORP|nr:Uncharacterised protein [Porphyromonas macacae]
MTGGAVIKAKLPYILLSFFIILLDICVCCLFAHILYCNKTYYFTSK